MGKFNPKRDNKQSLPDSEALRAEFMRIDNFGGEFDYLDTDYRCHINFQGLSFNSVSSGIQFLRHCHVVDGLKYQYEDSKPYPNGLQDYLNDIDFKRFPEDAKVNPFWNDNRRKWIELLLRDKYRRNEALRKSLSQTGSRTILYRSDDLFLGSDGKHGQNVIGRITEDIRKQVIDYTDHRMWLYMCQGMSKEDFWITLDEYKDDHVIQKHLLEGKCCYDIGRIVTCEIRPGNPSISRIHASLCMKKTGEICIITYNKVTGATVNGRYLQAHEPFALRSGDMLTIGASRRIYRIRIDKALVEKKKEQLKAKRLELRRQAEIKAKQAQNELDAYLHGSEEVVVSNINYKTRRVDLYDFFGQCGEIEHIQLPQERGAQDSLSEETQAVRGFAIIRFKDKKGAASAIERDGRYFNFRKLSVKYKTQQRWKEESGTQPQKRSRSRSSSRNRSRRHRDHRRSYRSRSPSTSDTDSNMDEEEQSDDNH